MQETHEARHLTDNGHSQRCECGAASGQDCRCNTEQEDTEEKGSAACYVLMNSARYGTEAWPCNSLEAAVQTLAHQARSAEQRRQTDGIQRYFCIKGSDLPAQEEPVGSDPVNPVLPEADALTLTLHSRETCHCPMSQAAQERDMREVVRLLCREDEEADKQASPSTSPLTENAAVSEVGA